MRDVEALARPRRLQIYAPLRIPGGQLQRPLGWVGLLKEREAPRVRLERQSTGCHRSAMAHATRSGSYRESVRREAERRGRFAHQSLHRHRGAHIQEEKQRR